MSPRSGSLLGGSVAALTLLAVGGCGGSDTATDAKSPSIVRKQPALGLPYLLYTSDRDGDGEIYGVQADGKQTVQITRDEADIEGASISPNGKWLTVYDPDRRPRLVSTDGRLDRALAVRYIWGEAFSRDGKLFAYSEDPDSMWEWHPPRVLITATGSGRTRVLGRGEVWSFSPRNALLATFDSDVDPPDQEFARLTFFDAVSGRTVRALDIVWPDDAPMYEVGWSPSGSSLAFLNGQTLEFVDVTGDSWEPRAVLRDPRLDEESWYDMPVRWVDDETLSLLLESEEDDEPELSIVSREGAKTVLADDVRGYPDPVWSPDGENVAYVVQKTPSRVEVVRSTRTGVDARVLFHARSVDDVAWASDDRLVVAYKKADRSVLAFVALDGRSEDMFRTRGYPMFGELSPDGRFLSLGARLPADEGPNSDGKAVGILSLLDGSVARVPVAGNVDVIGWADSSVSEAGAPLVVPSPELASANHLRASGEIAEISASGPRVAAIIESSKLDCQHVVAWTAGSSRVVRFAEPRPCGSSGGEEELVGIALEGTRLTWTGESWGNYAYLTDKSADMRRPESGVRSSGGDEGYESGVDRPRPERATRRGVSVRVDEGAVVLARTSDGRTVRLLAPGPVVDAELENEGLFYAYNASGGIQGHIVFVSFANLFD